MIKIYKIFSITKMMKKLYCVIVVGIENFKNLKYHTS